MVSVTGSTEVGGLVARTAADSIKRVSQELGGKSANIVFDDVDVRRVVAQARWGACTTPASPATRRRGCSSPSISTTRRAGLAARAAAGVAVGDPRDPATFMGPVAGRKKFDTVQGYIEAGLAEGARLVAGGPSAPPASRRASSSGPRCSPT